VPGRDGVRGAAARRARASVLATCRLAERAKEPRFLRRAAARRLPLPDLPLFRDLAPEARRVLAAAPRRRFRRGETLWAAGADAEGLAVVLSGRVRVVRAPDGRQYGVHTEGPGGTLGEVPFFAGGRYPATALAAEPTTCLWLDRATLARAVAADPDLAFRWLGRLALRVRGLVERLDGQTVRTVEQRLAALLLERHAAARGQPFALARTQAEAAEELGTVREVVVRALRRFREAGLVDAPARGRYRVRDPHAVARVAAR
jgi:CRP/FNR family transcriptional regulator